MLGKKLKRMRCKKCQGRLEVLRMCRKVHVRCRKCGLSYQIQELGLS